MIVDRRFRGAYCLHHSSLMMEAVRTSETSVDNHFTRQYIPEDNSEHHTHRRENLKSHNLFAYLLVCNLYIYKTEF
jgi:homoserine trans-succinylase